MHRHIYFISVCKGVVLERLSLLECRALVLSEDVECQISDPVFHHDPAVFIIVLLFFRRVVSVLTWYFHCVEEFRLSQALNVLMLQCFVYVRPQVPKM